MNLIKLNLARNCLKYLIRAYGIKEIFIPYYTCETVWKSIREEKCKIKFYHINDKFIPTQDFPIDAFILYTNYFGLCSNQCQNLASKYPNLIIDNSQGYYANHCGLASFNSLRKFFLVPNGAYLFTNKIINTNFEKDTIKIKPTLIHQNYPLFVKNELMLNKEKSIKNISPSTEKILNSINFKEEAKNRRKIYLEYEKVFNPYNSLHLHLDNKDVPYCYPLIPNNLTLKNTILDHNIILLKLWKNYPQNSIEAMFNDLVALPLNDNIYANEILNLLK